jgi:hypothetical protein
VYVIDKGVAVEYQEALNVLEAVKARYQAFDKLEEVARLLAGQDQHIKEMKEHAAELDRQLIAKRRTMKAMDERCVELEALIKTQQETYGAEQTKWQSAVQEEQHKYNQLVEDLELAAKHLAKQLEEQHNAARRGYMEDIQELEERRMVLIRQVEEIKSRVGGL